MFEKAKKIEINKNRESKQENMGRRNLNWTLKDFDLVNVEFLVDDADLEVDVVREGEFQ